MKRSTYGDRDYAFGQTMLALRSAIGLTQAGLADFLGVSRRAVGEWEAGSSYPKAENLKSLITLAVQHQAFPEGHEADEIRSLWQATHQKVLLDERWLAGLLGTQPQESYTNPAPFPTHSTEDRHRVIDIPVQRTSFIGRSTELAEIKRILSDPACRLLTLLGPGGIGKTRLALEVASRETDTFADGVVFVALPSVATPNQIVPAIGDALNLSFTGLSDPTAHLLAALRERHLFLVLDNFEHLLEGADLVYDIIERARHVTLLITSRERLNLQAEWLFDVKGLSFPSEDARGSITSKNPADATNYSAVQLFIQRASQIQLSFTVSEATLTAIVHICQYVAGMPLAIELAAAGVRALPVIEIERQIRSNIDVLATNLRDVPARHRSLRAVFDHSWNLLSEPERALLSRLAVFRGGCTAAAAQQVAGATLFALETLVNKSLVRHTTIETAESEPRFVLLEPIQEYAREQLVARGDAEVLQRAHAAYYLDLAEAIIAQWDSPTANTAIQQLDRELDNMRAVLQWARDGGDFTLGLQLAGVLWRFWRGGGYISEGRAWLEGLLPLDSPTSDATAISARIRATHLAAWLASDQYDFVNAEQLFKQSMALQQTISEESDGETSLILNAALQARAVGQYQRATELLEEALARQRAVGDRGSASTGGLGLSLYMLGLVFREQGNFTHAIALYKECVNFHRAIGERDGLAQGLMGLADVARDQGDVVNLRVYSEQSLATFREFGTQWAIGFALNNLALAAYWESNLEQALALVNESIALFRAIKNDGALVEVLITLGHILQTQGNETGARQAFTEALRLAWIVGPRLMAVAALEGLATAMTLPDQAALVIRFLGAASTLRTEMGAPVRPVDQPLLDQTLTTARLALDVDDFATMWSEASELRLERIMSTISSSGPLDVPLSIALPLIVETPAANSTNAFQHMNLGGVLSVPTFYGRGQELDLLTQWLIDERCRVVSVVGMGGIGKSAVAIHLMHQVAEHFEVIIWRSLRDIPTCEVLLDDLLQVFAPQVLSPATVSVEQRLSVLMEHLRSTHALLVLDNVESVLEEGENMGRMRPGYEGFGRFLQGSAETEHQSCVLLTSREKPNDLLPHEGVRSPVRTLRLSRLDTAACEQLLEEKNIKGDDPKRTRLIEAYAGNPLALKIVAQTIADLFDGEIAPFLDQGEVVFGGINELLNEQFKRLSAVERKIILWLAILRELTTLDELMAILVAYIPRARLLEAVERLHHRSLIERGQKQSGFTLQSVVMEYATAQLIAKVSSEIEQGEIEYLLEYSLELSHSREYVRQTQERLIVLPILAHLHAIYAEQTLIEEKLLLLLNHLTTRPDYTQGYAPANLIALLRLQRGNLRGVDLSRLALRGVYLQGVDMQDAVLSESIIQDSVFTETFDAMIAVAISPNGDYWAASSRRGEVRVWKAGGQTLYRAWRGHTDMVWALAFSPDGQTLASGSWDSTVKIWDFTSGALLWSGKHTSHVNSLAFAPDGSRLASAGNDATVRLWDTRSGDLLQTLKHPDFVIQITWHSDGHLLATGDVEGIIRLWEVNNTEPATCVQTFVGHPNYVDGLAFAPNNGLLASGSWDGTVKLWDITTGLLRETLTGHTDRVSRVVWSPDGRLLASSSRDQTIWLWDTEQGSYRAVMQGHTAGVCGMAFTPDNRTLVSGSEDGTLRAWDTLSGRCIRVLQGYAASLYDVDWRPDGSQVVSGGSDGMITIYTINGGAPPLVLRGHRGIVFRVRWSPNSRWIASSEWDNSIRLWNAISGHYLQILRPPDDMGNFFYGLTWSPDGQRLVSGTYRSGIQVFEMTQGHQHWEDYQFSTWIRSAAWSPDGRQIAGGGDDGTLYLWDAADGRLLQQLDGHHSMISRVTWSPSGRQLASGGGSRDGGEMFVWDMQRGKLTHTFSGHLGIVSAVAWGLSEKQLISGDGDGVLRWWDVQSGECLRMGEAHQGTIQSLRRSPDGTKMASCGNDGDIKLWDLNNGEHLQTLRRDRPYERLNITGIKGLTEVQKAALRALGAVEKDTLPEF